MTVHQCHVDRAWSLLRLLQKQRDWWDCSNEDCGVGKPDIKEPPPSLHAQVPAHIDLPQAHASFPATQPEADKPDMSPDAAPTPLICKAGQALEEALKVGFGDGGATVQDPPSFLSDTEIFRRTVMTGKTEVTFKDMILRKADKVNGKTVKVSGASSASRFCFLPSWQASESRHSQRQGLVLIHPGRARSKGSIPQYVGQCLPD